jgi:hypothetical protein
MNRTAQIVNVLYRNAEITGLRQGMLLKAAGIQKREYYAVLHIIRSASRPSPLKDDFRHTRRLYRTYLRQQDKE